MSALADRLLSPENRPRLVEGCATLVETEVQAKKGLSGIAVKGAFAIVTKLKPGIIPDAIDRLLDDFVEELAPFYDEYQASETQDFASYLNANPTLVADKLLGVTDRRIQRVDKAPIKKAYQKLRPSGERYVAAAVPGLARVIEPHLKD